MRPKMLYCRISVFINLIYICAYAFERGTMRRKPRTILVRDYILLDVLYMMHSSLTFLTLSVGLEFILGSKSWGRRLLVSKMFSCLLIVFFSMFDSVCDEQFFGSLSAEVAAVTLYFNKRVQWLLHIHLASGFKKVVFKVQHKQARNHTAMIQESQNLITYASIMTLSAHALLEDYDKMHVSSEGAHFKSQLVGQHKEFLQSPWLVELLALYFNLKNGEKCKSLPELCPGCTCDVSNDKLMLTCMPHDGLKVEVEATCSICLDTVFDPIALSCGHMFCFSCACSIASVHTYEKLKKAKGNVKCPLCRETSAFASGIRLTELNLLIYRRCKDYWKARRERERKERMKEIKDHWSYRPEDIGTQVFFI